MARREAAQLEYYQQFATPPADGAPDWICVRCKRRRCVACGPDYWRKYAMAALLSGMRRSLVSFLTMTAPGVAGGLVDAESIAAWNVGAAARLNRFVQKVKRAYPTRTIDYYWVAELQQRGAIHYHIVITGLEFLAWSNLAPIAVSAGFGPQGKLDPVNNPHGAAAYLAKYMLKDVDEWPSGRRVWSCSQGWRVAWTKRKMPRTPFQTVNIETGEVIDNVSAWKWDMLKTVRAANDPLYRQSLEQLSGGQNDGS